MRRKPTSNGGDPEGTILRVYSTPMKKRREKAKAQGTGCLLAMAAASPTVHARANGEDAAAFLLVSAFLCAGSALRPALLMSSGLLIFPPRRRQGAVPVSVWSPRRSCGPTSLPTHAADSSPRCGGVSSGAASVVGAGVLRRRRRSKLSVMLLVIVAMAVTVAAAVSPWDAPWDLQWAHYMASARADVPRQGDVAK